MPGVVYLYDRRRGVELRTMTDAGRSLNVKYDSTRSYVAAGR
jgi:hypothetical protein